MTVTSSKDVLTDSGRTSKRDVSDPGMLRNKLTREFTSARQYIDDPRGESRLLGELTDL